MKWVLLIIFSGVTSAQNQLADAVARNNQGVKLTDDGRYAEAEKQLLSALRGKYDDDLVRAKVANNLASLYKREDRYSDVEKMYRNALQWRQKNLPDAS